MEPSHLCSVVGGLVPSRSQPHNPPPIPTLSYYLYSDTLRHARVYRRVAERVVRHRSGDRAAICKSFMRLLTCRETIYNARGLPIDRIGGLAMIINLLVEFGKLLLHC